MPEKRNITTLAHEWAAERLRAGDLAIDATCGNGHDTLFLAKSVGENGRVAAFDIQPEAIESARKRIEKSGLENVDFFLLGHEKMLSVLGEKWLGNVSAVFFNLGYLPRSDKSITTHGDTTLRALEAARKMLAHGGIISIAVYTKHLGGFEESARIRDFAEHAGAQEIRRFGAHNPETPWLVRLAF